MNTVNNNPEQRVTIFENPQTEMPNTEPDLYQKRINILKTSADLRLFNGDYPRKSAIHSVARILFDTPLREQTWGRKSTTQDLYDQLVEISVVKEPSTERFAALFST